MRDPVSHMCLAGAVVASWPLTQEVAGSVITNIFVTEHLGRTPLEHVNQLGKCLLQLPCLGVNRLN